MANISVKISPDSKINDLSYDDQYNYGISNISSNIDEVKNRVSKGGNPFLLGVSEFRDKATFVYEKADFFVATFFPKHPLEFNELHFNGENVKFIIVHFDTVNLQFPRHIIFRGIEYINDSPVFVAPTDRSDYLGLYMSEWNKPNRPAIIQGITTVAEIDSSELINLNFSGQDRSNTALPSWGIKSNSGEMELTDTYDVIRRIKEATLLTPPKIDFYITCNGIERKIGRFIMSNVVKDIKSYKTKITFEDKLLSWNNIMVKIQLVSPIVERSLFEILTTAIKPYDDIDYMDEGTYDYLNSIILRYPYVYEGSLWNFMNKICEVSGCYISCDHNGGTVMKYDEGR